jgi:asparagine synthase (glutamine-hydrolysing)
MCGLAGFVHTGGESVENLRSTIAAMADALRHRGPDQDGIWIEGATALGHRRLSIIDLSDAARQPMVSADGRFVLVYNGEIYNYRALRAAHLDNYEVRLRSTSDSEVLLELIAQHGIEFTLPKLNGMFAFAIWDRRERLLHLARDRIGIKPLYWARGGSYFLFGSELKCLLHHPAMRRSLSVTGLQDYFDTSYITGERSIFDDCYKVRPGEHIVLSLGGILARRFFWSLSELSEHRPLTRDYRESFAADVDRLDELLQEVMSDQLRSDVPLGAFLSGGVDSSTVVAILRRQRPVKTFSIGYADQSFDESANARRIAEHLGTQHTEFILTPGGAAEIVEELPRMYDEPFADASQIPTHMVSRLAAGQVTVAMSGDGGDELFGGYPRYVADSRTWANVEMVPPSLRSSLSAIIGAVPANLWGPILRPILKDGSQSMPAFAKLLRDKSVAAYHHRTNYLGIGDVSRLRALDGAVAAGFEPGHAPTFDQLLCLDQRKRLPDGMLTKVDRASMAVGLEVRVPLLDNRILDYSWSVPTDRLVRNDENKAVLRGVLERYLPRQLLTKAKTGFHIPIRNWLGESLKPWAESLLHDEAPQVAEFLDVMQLMAMWNRYLGGETKNANALWIVLMFLSWNRAFREHEF